MSPIMYMNIAILILLVGAASYVAYEYYSEWRFQRSYARYRTRQHAARERFFDPTDVACDLDVREARASEIRRTRPDDGF